MKSKIITSIIGIILFSAACEKETKPGKSEENGTDRQQMLTRYADSIVIPAYDGFKTYFDVMYNAEEAFVANPGEATLQALRTAWVNAYIQWQTVELFDFGPGEIHALRNFCNIYPADTNGIKSNFSNPSANLEVPASYPQQGFPALDYLLNGVGSGDAAIVSYYTHATEGIKRKAYLQRITQRMKSNIEAVINDWKGAYREKFITKTGLDIGSSTSSMVNGAVLHYERFIRSGKIGIPSGAMLNGVPAQNKVEAFYKKDISKALAQSAHRAYIKFFNGRSYSAATSGPCFASYLNAVGAKDQASGKMLSQLINEQFEIVEAKLDVLKPDFHDQVLTNNEAMKAVFNEMQAAVRMLKVDMSSAMSITITYTDNDGD